MPPTLCPRLGFSDRVTPKREGMSIVWLFQSSLLSPLCLFQSRLVQNAETNFRSSSCCPATNRPPPTARPGQYYCDAITPGSSAAASGLQVQYCVNACEGYIYWSKLYDWQVG